jgi:hypothetical protein
MLKNKCGEHVMLRSWPVVLIVGAFLLFRGCEHSARGAKQLAEHTPNGPEKTDLASQAENLGHYFDRQNARYEIESGQYLQIGGGLVLAAGATLLVLSLVLQPKPSPSSIPTPPPSVPQSTPDVSPPPSPQSPPAPPAPLNERLSRIKLVIEIIAGIVGLIGAVLALFGWTRR